MDTYYPTSTPAAGVVGIVETRRVIQLGLAGLVREALGCHVITATSVGEALARIPVDGTLRALVLGLSGDTPPQTLVAEARVAGAPVFCAISAGDQATVAAALVAEADGYLALDAADVPTVRATLAGMSSDRRLVPAELEAVPRARPAPVLTDRCLAVLRHLADGLHDEEIAEDMAMSTNTVRKHVRTAEIRLGARTRTEAVAIAVRAGLLDKR